jgi:acetyl esterase
MTDAGAPPGAVPVRWYEPPAGGGAPAGPTVLWLHGGGFFRGGLDQPEAHAVAQALAARGVTVATVDYRVAPFPGVPWIGAAGRLRGRYPAALDDVMTAYREVTARGPGEVILGGASAGASLAAAATLRAVDEGARPAGAMFAYGFFHAAHPRSVDRRHRSRRHRSVTHAVWALDVMNRNYAGSRAALADRYAFAGGHDLTGFPRTLVLNAEHDNMRASGDRFAAELGAAGVDVQHHVLGGARHAFLNRPAVAEFARAVDLMAAWTREDRGD